MPTSPETWTTLAMRYNEVGGSIFNLRKFMSASKITLEQYLHPRVLWTFERQCVLADDVSPISKDTKGQHDSADDGQNVNVA